MILRILCSRAHALLLVPALLLVAACSVTAKGGPSATATPTNTPIPATCPQLPGLAAATPLTLPNMQLPAGTVAAAPVTSAGGAGQFKLSDYYACAPNSTTSLIVNSGKGPKPFADLILFYGWGNSTTFPADGAFPSSCGGGKCFSYLADTERYLDLKEVKDNGNGLITFHLVDATPPATPACHVPIFDSNPHPYIANWGGTPPIALPPLTKEGTSDGHAGSVTHYFCSAGTPATITAFMNQAFPAAGWAAGSGSYPANICTWSKAGGGVTSCVTAGPITDPANWVMTTHAPM